MYKILSEFKPKYTIQQFTLLDVRFFIKKYFIKDDSKDVYAFRKMNKKYHNSG